MGSDECYDDGLQRAGEPQGRGKERGDGGLYYIDSFFYANVEVGLNSTLLLLLLVRLTLAFCVII